MKPNTQWQHAQILLDVIHVLDGASLLFRQLHAPLPRSEVVRILDAGTATLTVAIEQLQNVHRALVPD